MDDIGTTDTGVGSGESVEWRAGTQKVILWFGDVPSHPTPGDSIDTVDQLEALTALAASGVTVIGLNSVGATFGIDQFGQATAITDGTGGVLINSFAGVAVGEIVTSILGAVGEALGTVDISLFSDPAAVPGLDISYACTDVLGCTNVAAGESRTLEMTVTGLAAGDYSYDTVLAGFPTVTEADRIIVGGVASVAAPQTLALMSVGLLIVGWAQRRRRQ